MEWPDAGARHGVRRVADAGIAARDGGSRQAVRRSGVSLAARQGSPGSGILRGDGAGGRDSGSAGVTRPVVGCQENLWPPINTDNRKMLISVYRRPKIFLASNYWPGYS